jgi:hypothetical protein
MVLLAEADTLSKDDIWIVQTETMRTGLDFIFNKIVSTSFAYLYFEITEKVKKIKNINLPTVQKLKKCGVLHVGTGTGILVNGRHLGKYFQSTTT